MKRGQGPRFGGQRPRARREDGSPGLESGDFVDVVGFYPVREAGAGRSFGPDRWPTTLHESEDCEALCVGPIARPTFFP